MPQPRIPSAAPIRVLLLALLLLLLLSNTITTVAAAPTSGTCTAETITNFENFMRRKYETNTIADECWGSNPTNTQWWKYEFCYNKWIRQVHQESNGAVASEYVLGLGPTALQHGDSVNKRMIQYTDGFYTFGSKLVGTKRISPTPLSCVPHGPRAAARELKDSHSVREYHPTFETTALVAKYSDGTVCDATSEAKAKKRETSVIFLCDSRTFVPFESQMQRMRVDGQHELAQQRQAFGKPFEILGHHKVKLGYNVSETSKCRYAVFVYGADICEAMHPMTKKSDHHDHPVDDATTTTLKKSEPEIRYTSQHQEQQELELRELQERLRQEVKLAQLQPKGQKVVEDSDGAASTEVEGTEHQRIRPTHYYDGTEGHKKKPNLDDAGNPLQPPRGDGDGHSKKPGATATGNDGTGEEKREDAAGKKGEDLFDFDASMIFAP